MLLVATVVNLINIVLLLYYSLKNDDFFDETSKTVYNQLTKTNSFVYSRVMLNIERFEIGSRYVTAKVQNRYGENVTINIQGGRPGIEIQGSLFKVKEEKIENPSYAYLITRLIQNSKILARKLPIVGKRYWLLIYEDTLLELSVKDAYDELEVVLVV
jgi:hypothetical protein